VHIDYAAILDRVHPEDRALRDGALKRALETQGEYEMEYRVQTPEGGERWISARGRCVRTANGKGPKLLGVSMDATKRKEAEELFRIATEGSPNGMLLIDEQGRIILLNGSSSAGKTTLVSLIPRFYEATTGEVLIDGVDVRRYRPRELRERIAIVLQDPVLFSGTIEENLRYGRLDATSDEIERAARAAHAHEFVSRLPKGYETVIAEAGGGLSGGERQRLSVARAILKNAPILILDEPTSSLDAISEEIVFAALRRLRVGRTTIVIAHRLSTVRDADQILVLDGGRIAAKGRHDELLKTSVLYRRMCARLSVGKSLDEPETVDELIQAARR
jgi:ABC-type transport system involved in cytochrome bd biosynthesis fused ATPase/permease subunit